MKLCDICVIKIEIIISIKYNLSMTLDMYCNRYVACDT